MKFFFITSSPSMARYVVNCGVDRLFVDLEVLGKNERQGHLNTVISHHTFQDLAAVRKAVPEVELMVRLNPVNPSTASEIEDAIVIGADILMLPMFRNPDEVSQFTDAVNGRVKVCLLVETVGAMQSLRECISVPGIHEVHIGLNDLHLELGNAFMFEPLANGLVDNMAAILRDAGMTFGIGGIARVGEGMLPAEMILAEHARLGSTAAILSRTFHRQASSIEQIQSEMDFAGELAKLRQAYLLHTLATPVELAKSQSDVKCRIAEIAARIKPKALSKGSS